MVEQTAVHRRTEDSFEEPLAAVELGLAELERWMCSAAWLSAVAALLGRIVQAGKTKDLVDRYERAA